MAVAQFKNTPANAWANSVDSAWQAADTTPPTVVLRFKDTAACGWINRSSNVWHDAEYPFTQPLVNYRSALESVYNITAEHRALLETIYGLAMASKLVSVYGNAPRYRSQLVQWYGDAPVLRSKLVSRYDDALQFRAQLVSVYALAVPHRSALESLYSIMAGRLLSQLDSTWDIRAVTPHISKLDSPWSLLDESSLTVSVACTATINGVAIGPEYVGYERSRDQYKINAELHVRSQSDALLAVKGAPLVIVAGPETVNLVVKSAGRQRKHASTLWTITAVSASVALEDPDGPLLSGTYGGVMASVLVNQWAAEVGVTIGWEIVDWMVPVDGVIAADQRPLDLIKSLLDEAAAILQTDLDGTVAVRYQYEIPVPDWQGATPDISLADMDDFKTTDEITDDRPGYNRFLITDEAAGGPEVRPEQVECDGETLIRAYIIPWGSYQSVTLRSSRDGAVIEARGSKAQTITQRDVEFIHGAASVDKPVYNLAPVDWQTDDLGAVTATEDGSLTAATAGESMADVVFVTRFFEWRVEVDDTSQLILEVE